jgi:hypothetical protein
VVRAEGQRAHLGVRIGLVDRLAAPRGRPPAGSAAPRRRPGRARVTG